MILYTHFFHSPSPQHCRRATVSARKREMINDSTGNIIYIGIHHTRLHFTVRGIFPLPARYWGNQWWKWWRWWWWWWWEGGTDGGKFVTKRLENSLCWSSLFDLRIASYRGSHVSLYYCIPIYIYIHILILRSIT